MGGVKGDRGDVFDEDQDALLRGSKDVGVDVDTEEVVEGYTPSPPEAGGSYSCSK